MNSGTLEGIVAHLDHVPQRQAILLVRQQRQEGFEIIGIELLGRRELPENRTEHAAELASAPAPGTCSIDLPASPSTLPVGDEAAGLQREDETIRHVGCPFGKGLRLLRTVIGAVDLDDLQLAAGIIQLVRFCLSDRIG